MKIYLLVNITAIIIIFINLFCHNLQCRIQKFFNSLGLPLITLNEGKIYPMSLQASSVLDILRLAIEDRQIPIYFNNKVKNIKKSNKGFVISTENEIFQCKN